MNNNTKNVDYEYEYEESTFGEYDVVQTHTLVWSIGLATTIAYVVIVCIGVPASIYVLYRLRKFAKEERGTYESGAGLGLFMMTTSGLFSLLAISLQYVIGPLTISASEMVKSLTCKTLTFATHTMASISIWSWLLMSILRYLAVHHPLFHLRLWRAPYRAVALIVSLSALTNVWLLFTISSSNAGCVEQPVTFGGVDGVSANRWLHLVECVWSYCMPVVVILYMDATVFLYYPWRSARDDILIGQKYALAQGTTAQPNNKKANRGLWKWLLIAFIDIALNTPENLYRLLVLIGMPVIAPDLYYYSFRMIAQVLYFSQFAFNSVYFCLFVLDKSIHPDAHESSTQSVALIETKLTNTQGYSTMECCRQNQFNTPTGDLEP